MSLEHSNASEADSMPSSTAEPSAAILDELTLLRSKLLKASENLSVDYGSEEFQASNDMVLATVTANGMDLQFAAPDQRANREIVLAAVTSDGRALQFACQNLRADRQIAIQAVTSNPLGLEFVSAKLKADQELVLKAVTGNGAALEFAAQEFQSNRAMVLEAVASNGEALQFVDTELLSDRTVVQTAVRSHGMALEFAHPSLQSDVIIVLEAVTSHGEALQFASPGFRSSRKIVRASVTSNGKALQYASEELQGDAEMVTAAMRSSSVSLDEQMELKKQIKLKRAARPQTVLPDRCGGEDQLNLTLQAHAIADVLASKDLITPFVTGIFGDWGSGKSFFMALIEKRFGKILSHDLTTNEFKDNIERYLFCGHLYTVHFNTWTYSKEDLWSSLMYKIFSDLNEQLDLEARIRSIYPDLCEQGIDFLELKAKLQSKNSKDALIEYMEKHKLENPGRLTYDSTSDGRVTKVLVDLMNQGYEDDIKELPQKVKELEDLTSKTSCKQCCFSFHRRTEEHFRLELKTFRENHPGEEDIDAMLKSVPIHRRWTKLFLGGIHRSPKKGLLILGFALVAIALGIVLYVRIQRTDLDETENTQDLSINAFAGGIGGTIIAEIVLVIGTIRWAKESLQELGVTTAIVMADNAGETSPDGKEHGRNEANDFERIRKLKNDISAIKNRRWLVEGDSLHDQVKSHLNISSYEDSLGVVHQAQEDLKMISNAMRQSCENRERNKKSSKYDPFPRGQPRIVLFIDDLDRCPPETVVEVIEALQLLLGNTDVFVAVVALDVSYVTRALEKVYKDILMKESGPSGIQFLHKIIQLPFSIPQMSPESMENYFKKQLAYDEATKIPTRRSLHRYTSNASVPPLESITESMSLKSPITNETISTTTASTTEIVSNFTAPSSRDHPPNLSARRSSLSSDQTARTSDDYVLSEESLKFSRKDVEMITAAGKAANVNPRSARMLANVFKILKLIWERSHDIAPGEEAQKAILLLIAMSASYPLMMAPILAKLENEIKNRSADRTLDDFIKCQMEIGGPGESRHWSYRVLRNHEWGEVLLSEIGYGNVRLVRSFSFVGDHSVIDD